MEERRKAKASINQAQTRQQKNQAQLIYADNKISGNYRQCNKPIRNSNGILLTTHEAQMRRWKEHLEQLLNQPEPVIREVINPSQTKLHIEMGLSTREDIYKAITLLNYGKTAGPDGIPAQLLKAGV